MRATLLAAALAVGALAATAAAAHPKLVSATPGPQAAVKGSPQAVRITFSERIILKFSGADVTDAAGKAVPAGPSAVDPKDRKTLVTPLSAPLRPGVYTVSWHAVAEDTHRLASSYKFTVQP